MKPRFLLAALCAGMMPLAQRAHAHDVTSVDPHKTQGRFTFTVRP